MTEQQTEIDRIEAPFLEVPGGVEIARYFWHEIEHRNPGCDGIDLYREGLDYCYLWVEAMVDLDMWEAYLLDVRTHVGVPPGEFGETRDFLFVFAGAGDRFDVEWFNQPIRPFNEPPEDPWERFIKAMAWFASRIEQAVEDAEKAPSIPPGEEVKHD